MGVGTKGKGGCGGGRGRRIAGGRGLVDRGRGACLDRPEHAALVVRVGDVGGCGAAT